MTGRSFRQALDHAPARYRTPSPPRQFVEPISPTSFLSSGFQQGTLFNNGSDGKHTRARATRRVTNRERKDARPGVMDAFALIALATTTATAPAPENNQSAEHWLDHDTHSELKDYVERPSKRAKSEKAASPQWRPTESRPSTSYVQPSDSRTWEAELLLNFSQQACFAIPVSPTKHSSISHHGVSPTQTIRSVPERQHKQSPVQQTRIFPQTIATPSADGAEISSVQDLLPKDHTISTEHHQTHDGATHNDSSESSLSNQKLNSDANTNSGRRLSNAGAWAEDATELSPSQKELVTPGGPDNSIEDSLEEFQAGANEELSTPQLEDNRKVPHNTANHVLEGDQDMKKVDMPFPVDVSNTSIVPSEVQTTPAISKESEVNAPSICAACNFHPNALASETEDGSTSWISCDGCKAWFHFACAGFKSEREVRGVDKYRCRSCKPIHGATTYVRKSARAHSAIDYAGLNEGVIKTSDENPEHHYIKPIKNGDFKFNQETFARMRPELISADYFEKGDGMKEPIVIPAAWNPRPRPIPNQTLNSDTSESLDNQDVLDELHDRSVLNEWLAQDFEYDTVQDQGQDALDMVIPQDLTVRKVSEMYGPEEKIEVIDVKTQGGEDKRWNMRKWVDYYESQGTKVVRNVISLEVSQSKLGRLIRRPKVVRDLDLQDAVWPPELIAKNDYPKVQFYCLMSVADCYTDFHIDFGGSSVYYHILKGKKTFFFIPPHEKHLKKYEEWCNSPAQNWTFLGDQTKECYRVDLSEGDTMLIPAGWIHAVWTPEDSLVIGGNFLTRMHYPLQIRVAQIEKATNVPRKYRYPHFQKLLWYTALNYLTEDPIPESVRELLISGQPFTREQPAYLDFDGFGENSAPGPENYHRRYYSKAELDGLPELGRYLQRTALIAMGSITDGISVETRNAVKRSIPKGHPYGEPLEALKKFALWYSWKRGNETIPHWAYPDYEPETGALELTEKKPSAATIRRLDREAAHQAYKVAPDRQSTRPRQQPQSLLAEIVANQALNQSKKESPAPSTDGSVKRKRDGSTSNDQSPANPTSANPKRVVSSTKPKNKRPACDACRKGRRACKHRDDPQTPSPADGQVNGVVDPISTPSKIGSLFTPTKPLEVFHVESSSQPANKETPSSPLSTSGAAINPANISPGQTKTSGRTKACKDCRKSKVSHSSDTIDSNHSLAVLASMRA